MKQKSPSYGRAFWITALLVGAVNVALACYYFSIPIGTVSKGGSRVGREVPDWHAGMVCAVNLPGGILALPILALVKCDSVIFNGGLWMAFGTLGWAFIAVRIEQDLPTAAKTNSRS